MSETENSPLPSISEYVSLGNNKRRESAPPLSHLHSKRRGSLGALKDRHIPRRLSELFLPPKSDKNQAEEDESEEATETTQLLEEGVSIQITPSSSDETRKKQISVKHSNSSNVEEDKISEVDEISSEVSERSPISDASDDSDDDNSNDKEGYNSWDDTICSNRSAYFKHYYQKNLSRLANGSSNNFNRPPNRTTSHSSLVTLIKEKNKTPLKRSDAERKKKKKEDMGLLVLVAFLFLVIIIGISLIYHFYNLHLKELSLFKRLTFHEERRLLNLLDTEGNTDIQARLGTSLPLYSKPEDCTHYLQYLYRYKSSSKLRRPSSRESNRTAVKPTIIIKTDDLFQFSEENVCLEWRNLARLQIHRAESQGNVNCYNVFWASRSNGFSLQDCMMIKSPDHGVWWGLGEYNNGVGFPLESIKYLSSTVFKTGIKHPFGRILRRTFLSSFGGLLILPDNITASVSIIPDELCIAANSTHSTYQNIPLTLNYTICSSPNISSTIDYLHYLARGSYDIKNNSEQEFTEQLINRRIENPLWLVPTEFRVNNTILKIDQELLLDYADEISINNSYEGGILLLPISWQSKIGDYEFDIDRFPDPNEMLLSLKEKGFDVALSISPLVSTDAASFSNGTVKRYWVQQRGSSLPALIEYGDVSAGALIDFTNPEAAQWFVSKITEIKEYSGINLFHLDHPDSQSIPEYHCFSQSLASSDLALSSFLNSVSLVQSPLSVESVISPPPLPTFTVLRGVSEDWDSLKSLIANILTLSMLGYPLIDAGPIGGVQNIQMRKNEVNKNLYIRWSQAIAFLPAFQMVSRLPAFDNETLSIIDESVEIRSKIAMPRLKQAISGTIVNNTPIIYPLGLLYPEDITAASIPDEWILGDDLLVAPIVNKDEEMRDIYIPEGLWESQLDGGLKRGPGWIKNYKIPLSKVAYFFKRYTIS